jgi:beta-glucosidase
MSELVFPEGFLWGAATSAHQTEGGNSNSDWWDWELKPDSPCAEPSGNAIEHYKRYARDIALLAGLGLNTYRFSLEWARIEPEWGKFDEAELNHYRRVVAAVRKSKLTPMVTLNHFTLPKWVAAQGGWLSDQTPFHFENYVRRVVETLGDSVDWYCTINEPGVVAFGGYMGGLPFPPGTRGLDNWRKASRMLVEGHRLARAVIKELRPAARVGLTHSMQEWESNAGGRPAMEYAREMSEDFFLRACADDDFIGVQAYTRTRIEAPTPASWLSRAALSVEAIEKRLVPAFLARQNWAAEADNFPNDGVRRTQMGWEWRPQASAAAVRRVAGLFPGKPIVVTEHGVGTADDGERIDFIRDGLAALHPLVGEGIPLQGYIHWSSFDNFEWAYGFRMTFGLIGVDRKTQERTIRPSGRYLGEIARSNRLRLDD